jgi:hypothetical protein
MGSRLKFAGLLLFLLFLCAGCISIGPPPPREDQGGLAVPQTSENPIQDITSRNAPKVSLEDALNALPAAEQEGSISVRGLSITKVWGYGVDSAGLARTWVLGTQGGGRTALFTYTDGEWRDLDLPTSLPQGEVKMDNLISPQDLFRKNLKTIVREMDRLRVGECDLTLDEDTYQIIIHSASESLTLSFSAKTGELMPSP